MKRVDATDNGAAGPRRTQGEGPVGRLITLGGVLTAAALMILALIESTRGPIGVDRGGYHFESLAEDIIPRNPESCAALACIALVLTPLLRLVWIAIMLSRSKRFGFACAAFGVIMILTGGLFFLWNSPPVR
ncbi:MAG: hypothetical protein HY286_01620 [Planctomycetes bacterium]|nr:hypothetical protein [Planctomycetota bacterium]